MEFMNRGAQHPTPKPTGNGHADAHPRPRSGKIKHFDKLTTTAYFILLFAGTILVIAVLVSLMFGKKHDESRFVDKENLQAVFLNNGQVYFGKIRAMDDGYIKLNNVYYLRVNNSSDGASQQSQAANPNDVSLAKLGCELHAPQDQMIINRTEVTFWENLKNDGQVAKAVDKYIADNKNGINCETTTNSTEQSTGGVNQQQP